MSNPNPDYCHIACYEAPRDGSIESLFRDVVRHEISDRHEECLRWFCEHPATPEELLLEIYESGLCLNDLGHRQGPPVLLEKLANEACYPEAILTLAIQLYIDSNVGTTEFSRFARRHSEDFWMLDTLVRRVASSGEKESVLNEIIALHPEAERLRGALQVNRWTTRAAEISDPDEIERLYGTGEPAVWLALAGNPTTPRRLIERLAEVKDVPLARRIRNRAREALNAD
jgi:hypothetical protein